MRKLFLLPVFLTLKDGQRNTIHAPLRSEAHTRWIGGSASLPTGRAAGRKSQSLEICPWEFRPTHAAPRTASPHLRHSIGRVSRLLAHHSRACKQDRKAPCAQKEAKQPRATVGVSLRTVVASGGLLAIHQSNHFATCPRGHNQTRRRGAVERPLFHHYSRPAVSRKRTHVVRPAAARDMSSSARRPPHRTASKTARHVGAGPCARVAG